MPGLGGHDVSGKLARSPVRLYVVPVTGGNEFGRTLQGLRTSASLSQGALGEAAGISGDYVGKLERGDAESGSLSVEVLLRIAQGVDADLEALEALFLAAGSRHRDFWFYFADKLAARSHTRVPLEFLIENTADLDAEGKTTLRTVYRALKEQSDNRRMAQQEAGYWDQTVDHERRKAATEDAG